MSTRKKSIKSRSKRTYRKQSKFITPDLALVGGKLMRFVANQDSPLSEAERLRGKYAEMEDGNDAEVRQFLQRAYFVALQFRRRPGEFERLQVHPFWKQAGQKPRDSSTSKWVLLFIMQATTPDKYAVILDGLMQTRSRSARSPHASRNWAASMPRTKRCRCEPIPSLKTKRIKR